MAKAKKPSLEVNNPEQTTLSLIKPFIGIAVLYVALICLLPANNIVMDNYNLTSGQYRILFFLVQLPYIIIWFTAFYGYSSLQKYTTSLKRSPESEDFRLIAKGVKYLAFGMPLISLIAICLNSISNMNQSFTPIAIITINYLSLLVPLIAYTTIRKGTHGLADRAKVKFSIADTRSIMFTLVIIGVAYCYFTFRKLNLDSLGASDNPYYLPAWLMISTVLIPYLFAWFSGLLAAYEIVLYSRQVQGVLYRQSMRLLSLGIVGVIAGGVGLQYLRTVLPRTGYITINNGLVWSYIFYVFLAVGFSLLILGAIRLKRIEDV